MRLRFAIIGATMASAIAMLGMTAPAMASAHSSPVAVPHTGKVAANGCPSGATCSYRLLEPGTGKPAVNSQRAVTPRAVVNLGLSITQAKAVQVWLDYYGYNAGTVDGQLGPNSWKAFQRELKQYWGYSGNIDGIVGPLTVEALQRLLTNYGYPSNEIDGNPGPKTQAAFARFANALINSGF